MYCVLSRLYSIFKLTPLYMSDLLSDQSSSNSLLCRLLYHSLSRVVFREKIDRQSERESSRAKDKREPMQYQKQKGTQLKKESVTPERRERERTWILRCSPRNRRLSCKSLSFVCYIGLMQKYPPIF